MLFAQAHGNNSGRKRTRNSPASGIYYPLRILIIEVPSKAEGKKSSRGGTKHRRTKR